MINKKNHKCIVCGTAYIACNNCNRINNWRAICDTEDHYRIHIMLNEYRTGRMSKEDATAVLTRIGISYPDTWAFMPVVADMLRDILAVSGESVDEVVVVDSVEEQPIEQKPKTRGRKKKVEAE